MTIRFSPRRLAVLIAALLLVMLAGASSVTAAEEGARDARDRPSDATRGTPDAPRCVHGCLRWGKFCDVDPRGVYKCQRRCEKFGEICE